MYPLRLLLWTKPASHTHRGPSSGLLSWRWHNQHGLLIRRCQTWITFIALTGRHWTQTSLKNIYWENCFKVYLSTEKKIVSLLKQWSYFYRIYQSYPPATPLPPEIARVQEHPGSSPSCVVCKPLPKVIKLPGATRTVSCREVIASVGWSRMSECHTCIFN